MKTVFVLVDALKSLYLTEENMPFLYSLSKKSYYVEQIIPCSGFCERSEIFSGLDGYDTGNFTAIGYLPEESPYRKDGFIISLFCLVELFSKRVARRLFSMWRVKQKRRMGCYRIPFKSLNNFALTEDGNKRLVAHRDIFDELKEAKLHYTLDGFTALSDLQTRSKMAADAFAISEIEKGTDFIPVYIGEIDSMGHKYGKDIDSLRPYLKKVDDQLKRIYEVVEQHEYAFCVMGDHGMVPVKKKVDVITGIKELGLRLHKDYEAFYDSTLARFWFNNKEAEQRVIRFLQDSLSKDGIIVDESNCEEFRVPLRVKNSDGRPVYGDFVWCANPGVLISPDYFHKAEESENGMHGYIEVVEGHGTGLFVKYFKNIQPIKTDKAESSEICGELCALLGVKKPN